MTPPEGAQLEAVSAGSDTDPMETFTLDDVGADPEASDFPIPEANILGGRTEPAKKKGSAAEPEIAKADEATDVHDGQPRGKDGKFGSAKRGETTEDPGSTTEVKPTPFRFRAMGQTHDLEGAQLNDKGDLTIPAAKVSEIREALNAHRVLKEGTLPKLTHLEGETQRLTTENAHLKASRSLAESQADGLVKALETLFSDPDETAAAEKFFKMRDDYPSLRAKSEVEYWKTQATKGGKPETAPPKAAPAVAPPVTGTLPSREEAVATTTGHLEGYKVEHEYRDIPEADWKQFEASVERTPMAFVRAATADDAAKFGVTAGEAVYDTDLLHAAVTEFVTLKRQSRETAETTARRAADAARRTAPKVNAPPVPGTARTPAKSGKTSAITSKEDFNEWLDNDSID